MKRPPCSDYAARVRAGWCAWCNDRAVPGSPLCPRHSVHMRESYRRRRGSKTRRKGARSYRLESKGTT